MICILARSNGKLREASIKYIDKEQNKVRTNNWLVEDKVLNRINNFQNIKIKIERYVKPPIIPSSVEISRKSL